MKDGIAVNDFWLMQSADASKYIKKTLFLCVLIQYGISDVLVTTPVLDLYQQRGYGVYLENGT